MKTLFHKKGNRTPTFFELRKAVHKTSFTALRYATTNSGRQGNPARQLPLVLLVHYGNIYSANAKSRCNVSRNQKRRRLAILEL